MPPLLIRIFGGEGLIDRVKDNLVFASLAKAGLGPQCYGLFSNGRVEEFLDVMPQTKHTLHVILRVRLFYNARVNLHRAVAR